MEINAKSAGKLAKEAMNGKGKETTTFSKEW